jgi:C-terminal processing protease CtpA/Prc
MKKISLFIFIILFNQIIFAQKDQYYDFMKTWNFIKYYHPDVASGKIDADSLFLNTAKNINSKDDFNSVIHKLSQNLNKNLSTSAPTETSKDVLSKNQNFDWFQKNGKISSVNKNLLNNIYNHRYNFELLKDGKSVSTEKKYSFPKNENLPFEYRLLALAKIQGVVDYLFPHKYLMDKGFEDYFKNSLSENLKITSRKDFETLLAKLSSKLKDSHAFSFYKQLSYRGDILNMLYLAPFDFQIIDDHILVTHLIYPEMCSKAHIAVGDKITSINGKSIPQIIKEKGELLSTSNKEKLVFLLSKYENNLIWPDNLSQKSLEVTSGKSGKKFITKLDMIDIKDKEKYNFIVSYIQDKIQKKESRKIVDKDIAYFKINQALELVGDLENDQLDARMDSIIDNASQKKAIVFDMRGYPNWGGFINHYIYKYFSPVENYFYKYYAPNLKNIGTFYYLEDSKHYFPNIKDKKMLTYSGKVFILVNPETQSASEWYSMSLQKIFPKSLTIGQQSAGADGDVVKVNLPGDYVLEFTGNGIFYPDNSQTQQTGIRIDEIIKYKDTDILSNRDLEFERIISLVK